MLRNSQPLVCALAVLPIGMVLAAEPYPAGAQSEKDPKVIAYYQGQCDKYATAQGLQGKPRNAFVQKCLVDAPKVWPVGSEPASDLD